MLVTLISSDGQSFEVDEEILTHCETLAGNFVSSEPFPIPNVDGRILKLVIDWLTQHKDDVVEAPDEQRRRDRLADYPKWDQDFVGVRYQAADKDTLFLLILAANFLNIKGLLDLACRTVTDLIRGKTPEEIRQTFKIKDEEYTVEEKEQIRKANAWVEE